MPWGRYFLIRGYWECAAGWGRISRRDEQTASHFNFDYFLNMNILDCRVDDSLGPLGGVWFSG